MALDEAALASWRTPALYPVQLSGDGQQAELMTLSEADYRAASFLDQRLLDRSPAPQTMSWRDLSEAAAGRPAYAHFIFHLGHVGSTLLSRLLGEHPAVFSVREPALLRDVAAAPNASQLKVLLKLFARVWRPQQTALIKATSFVSQIGAELMVRTAPGRAILLSAAAPAYVRTLLAGPASLQEGLAMAETRRLRLEARLGAAVRADTVGERLVMGWLCEVLALYALAAAHPERCLWLDFDRLLADPSAVLKVALTHLDADPALIDLPALVGGPILTRYSKAPEHAYDAALRRELLAEAGRDRGADVHSAMAWLQRMADAHPGVRPAILRAAAAARGPLAAAGSGL